MNRVFIVAVGIIDNEQGGLFRSGAGEIKLQEINFETTISARYLKIDCFMRTF